MKSRSRMQQIIAIVVAAAAYGCATASPPQHPAEVRSQPTADLGNARSAWEECVKAQIARLDEPPATSAAVARAAMNSCLTQYTQMMQVLSGNLAATCGSNADCTQKALAKAERDATQTALDDVTSERVKVAGAQVLKCL